MCRKKLFNDLPFMPASPIHEQVEGVTPQMLVQVCQDFEKSFPIPSLSPNHSIPTQQGGHPSREIQPSLMLAGGEHTKPLPNSSPTETQTRVQTKPCLILKNYGFLGPQTFQFFLKPCETAWPPPSELEGKHNLLSSVDTLTDASNAALASPSALTQTSVSDVRPPWVHPNAPDSNQTLLDSSLNARPVLSAYRKLVEPVDPPGFAAEVPISHSDLSREPIGLNSSGLAREPSLSTPASALRPTAIKQQSLSRPKRQGRLGRKLKDSPFSLRDSSKKELGFS